MGSGILRAQRTSKTNLHRMCNEEEFSVYLCEVIHILIYVYSSSFTQITRSSRSHTEVPYRRREKA